MARREPRLPYGVRLIVSYDGTDFHGWQAQPKVRTVQSTLEKALKALSLETSRMRGASRTDAGVHARGQVVSFACDRELPEKAYTLGLNGLLPEDVSVRSACAVDRRYDPRNDAAGKLYRYQVVVGETTDPLLRRTTWRVGPQHSRPDVPRAERREVVADYLDLERMREAAAHLVGTHDFRAFRAASDDRENTERTMTRIDVVPDWAGRPDRLAIEVEGTAFMKNMVRILAGTLLDVGRHRMNPDQVARLLGPEGRREEGGPTAPAHGLCLERIDLGRGDHARAVGGILKNPPARRE
ncbi:MAG: tRNA pseudouridine(38-40) synthase TruA [Sandaracinus sp.]|nr:tRNA pseudouridine(38-40) synthase TruA [Sandaracinus sp.]|tara:strand:+ start:1525 stop:2415 length:891 start_codon:yes stop_codon:yes gene_type:complete